MVGFSEKNFEFFKIAKASKYAVEFDCKSKDSQNVQNLGLFSEIDDFPKQNLNFFEISKGGKLAVECVSNGIIS